LRTVIIIIIIIIIIKFNNYKNIKREKETAALEVPEVVLAHSRKQGLIRCLY